MLAPGTIGAVEAVMMGETAAPVDSDPTSRLSSVFLALVKPARAEPSPEPPMQLDGSGSKPRSMRTATVHSEHGIGTNGWRAQFLFPLSSSVKVHIKGARGLHES
eukprot:6184818-Pleurochrysis_carterae.AAC.2